MIVPRRRTSALVSSWHKRLRPQVRILHPTLSLNVSRFATRWIRTFDIGTVALPVWRWCRWGIRSSLAFTTPATSASSSSTLSSSRDWRWIGRDLHWTLPLGVTFLTTTPTLNIWKSMVHHPFPQTWLKPIVSALLKDFGPYHDVPCPG